MMPATFDVNCFLQAQILTIYIPRYRRQQPTDASLLPLSQSKSSISGSTPGSSEGQIPSGPCIGKIDQTSPCSAFNPCASNGAIMDFFSKGPSGNSIERHNEAVNPLVLCDYKYKKKFLASVA